MQGTLQDLTAKPAGIGGELAVDRLGCGAMRLTGDGVWGEPRDPDECKRMLRTALELDVSVIDTVDAYGRPRPESTSSSRTMARARSTLVRCPVLARSRRWGTCTWRCRGTLGAGSASAVKILA
jgi:hypothetical protein